MLTPGKQIIVAVVFQSGGWQHKIFGRYRKRMSDQSQFFCPWEGQRRKYVPYLSIIPFAQNDESTFLLNPDAAYAWDFRRLPLLYPCA